MSHQPNNKIIIIIQSCQSFMKGRKWKMSTCERKTFKILPKPLMLHLSCVNICQTDKGFCNQSLESLGPNIGGDVRYTRISYWEEISFKFCVHSIKEKIYLRFGKKWIYYHAAPSLIENMKSYHPVSRKMNRMRTKKILRLWSHCFSREAAIFHSVTMRF